MKESVDPFFETTVEVQAARIFPAGFSEGQLHLRRRTAAGARCSLNKTHKQDEPLHASSRWERDSGVSSRPSDRPAAAGHAHRNDRHAPGRLEKPAVLRAEPPRNEDDGCEAVWRVLRERPPTTHTPCPAFVWGNRGFIVEYTGFIWFHLAMQSQMGVAKRSPTPPWLGSLGDGGLQA